MVAVRMFAANGCSVGGSCLDLYEVDRRWATGQTVIRREREHMATKKPLTERQRRLGAELRKMRERAGLSLTEAAAVHRTDKTIMSNTESGRFGVSSDRVRVWAANYQCPDAKYVDALVDMARERRAAPTHWWDDYRDVLAAGALDLAEMEHHAVALTSVQATHIPGLLQHEDYARAVFGQSVPPLDPDDYERKLSYRLRRSVVLDRAPCTFIVHEAALRMRFGGTSATRAQLKHLLKQSERENVTIHVLPFEAGEFPSAGGAAHFAHGPVAPLDTVQKDTPMGPSFLHSEAQLINYRAVLERMQGRALAPGRSLDFIRTVAQDL